MRLIRRALAIASSLFFASAPCLSNAQPAPVQWKSPPDGELRGWWWAPKEPGQHPAVVLLHGCGGMLNKSNEPNVRTTRYAQLLQQQGWGVLALDSFSGRGVKEICTRSPGSTPAVPQARRRADMAIALPWLTKQPSVDSEKLALIGWSNGGSTVLGATHRGFPEVADIPKLSVAIAYYPGCVARLKYGYEPTTKIVMLLGMADDWTPAKPCLDLASEHHKQITVHAWADAYHGFDATLPVRLRSDVGRGVNPGKGVHVGANPAAREQSQVILIESLRQAFGPGSHQQSR